MYRDSSGKALTDYPRPSVAVDTAVLTVPPGEVSLDVVLVRADGGWALVSCVVSPGFEFAGFELAETGWAPGN